MSRMRVLCTVGTRPEAIKMAPVIQALAAEPWADVRILATAQHRDLLDGVLRLFNIQPDVDLDIMRSDQPLATLTARLLDAVDGALASEAPDMVIAQGDTSTVFATALACFYRRIPFGHVEAGLRTGNLESPFPEEMNRVAVTRLTRWHFAPTEAARQNLCREGVPDADITVSGNTVIDALLQVAARSVPLDVPLDPARRLVLVTAHRRENFGERFRSVCRAIRAIADRNADVQVLYPVHPNPNVRRVVTEVLADHPRIVLCEPLDYGPFVTAMQRAHIILTDSGGVQEEAPALGRPVLVLRHETERPEAVVAGVARLVGTDFDSITTETQRLLDDEQAYAAMASGASPYGDGRAAQRIVNVLAGVDGATAPAQRSVLGDSRS
jgi:UDP-N-acetylglucosamine 2-epimerase (non-hydrolysing)